MDERTLQILEALHAMRLRAEANGSTQAAECYAEALAVLVTQARREHEE